MPFDIFFMFRKHFSAYLLWITKKNQQVWRKIALESLRLCWCLYKVRDKSMFEGLKFKLTVLLSFAFLVLAPMLVKYSSCSSEEMNNWCFSPIRSIYLFSRCLQLLVFSFPILKGRTLKMKREGKVIKDSVSLILERIYVRISKINVKYDD